MKGKTEKNSAAALYPSKDCMLSRNVMSGPERMVLLTRSGPSSVLCVNSQATVSEMRSNQLTGVLSVQ